VGEPSAVRRKLLPSGNAVAVVDEVADVDAVSAEAHKRIMMDKIVLAIADYDPSIPPCNIFLLSTIVAESKGLLDRKYANHPEAKDLLEEHEELRSCLTHGKTEISLQ
jgi:hypothetical protein